MVATLAAAAPPAAAESALLLEPPLRFGRLPAATYDFEGHRIGESNVVAEEIGGGLVRLVAHTSRDDGANTLASTELERVEDGHRLRLIHQQSQSVDPDGRPLDLLEIDHRARVARCTSRVDDRVSEIHLPERDRVVNVPMNLLLRPLVRGDRASVEFQIFLCTGGARIYDFHAWVAHREDGDPVEVQYGPDFGSVVTALAQGLLPRLSFWFGPEPPYPWLGHRLPLYADGPEVLVVRAGVDPKQLR